MLSKYQEKDTKHDTQFRLGSIYRTACRNSIKKSTLVTAENLSLINVTDDLKSDISIGLVQEAIFIAQVCGTSTKPIF